MQIDNTPVTSESVASAHADAQRERAAIAHETGVAFTADGRILHRASAYWTARGLDPHASAQGCGCDPAAGHLCDRHLEDYEQFVFAGREPAA